VILNAKSQYGARPSVRSSSRRISFGTQWVETMSSGKTASGSVAAAGIHSRMAGHGRSMGSKVSRSNGGSGGGGMLTRPSQSPWRWRKNSMASGRVRVSWAEGAVAVRALEGIDGPDGLDEVAPERAHSPGGSFFGWGDEENLGGRP